ncbi:cobalt transporter [Cyanobacterium aponinum UTEX 3222]|uniref:cobalt transporter n=1 Tax=Cyanobacterium aponinum TaxID=379064 RepID=UPI002B4BB750|nr:cobalt transporter [Cyanobacterium aponinum]WRL37985.1 cobalt transporter [Cyanobacterium aponinum UTEX 3221]WRL41535.1 cobalt transporter [Cyanobacterium aponinum UTEX 3222]
MKSLSLTSILSLSLIFSTPSISYAHVGHGDEFQATGGIERVEVKPETDSLLGIEVSPIEQASADGVGVMIPITALVDADGKQLVFVQYDNFYEPVEVTTGITEGEFIQVTKELSVGEKLVTQGSLSLYAESRKTQSADTTETTSNTEETTTSEPIITDTTTHAEADKQGIPHSHDKEGNLVNSAENTEKSGGFPIFKTLMAVGGLGVVGLMGLFTISAFTGNGNKKKSRNQYDYTSEE